MPLPLYKDGTAAGVRPNNDIKLAHIYRGLTLNNPADDPDNTYELGRVMWDPVYDDVIEPFAQRDGSEGYEVRRVQALLTARGIIKATSHAALWDKVNQLNYIFDPVNVVALSASVGITPAGFAEYAFSVPTADLTNYPTGLIPMVVKVRSRALPVTQNSKNIGLSMPFELDMLAVDPRKYLAGASSYVERTNFGVLSIDNTLATYNSWPIMTLTLSSNPATTAGVRFQRSGGGAATVTFEMLMDGPPVSGDVITVDMEKREIKVNGVVDMRLVTNAGDYWSVPRGGNTYTLTWTNIGTGTQVSGVLRATWRRAFA